MWGYYDGSGTPIELTFVEYYQGFVYAQEVGYNQVIGVGNSINNSSTLYPDAVVVKYHLGAFQMS